MKTHGFRRVAQLLAVLAFVLAPAVASADWSQGQQVEVKWNGFWYLAEITQVDRAHTPPYRISYVEWEKKWDEWVGNARIRAFSGYHVGNSVQVQWKGKYYAAKILKVNGRKYFITYPGWDHKWDEWVTVRRMRR